MPKRGKAAAAKKTPAPPPKKAKRIEKNAAAKKTPAPPPKKAKRIEKNAKAIKALVEARASVYEDYDTMLYQTNIGVNNNKYYIIQVIESGNKYYAWNRMGRVGESGDNDLKGSFTDPSKATKEFEKKFREKTGNDWANRNDFETLEGKYTMHKMDAQEETSKKLDEDQQTQVLMKLIFGTDMFKEAMAPMEIGVKTIRLGKLSKAQIDEGFKILDRMKKEEQPDLQKLSSEFYTAIPHDFGRKRPETLSLCDEQRKELLDMLWVLADIELAQAMQKDKQTQNSVKVLADIELAQAMQKDTQTQNSVKVLADIELAQAMQKDKQTQNSVKGVWELPKPLDQNYEMLQCELELLDKNNEFNEVIDTYTKNTSCGSGKPTIQHVWKVNMNGEDHRFSQHDNITERKLLWHGTNVAVVAAILENGIMPHSGDSKQDSQFSNSIFGQSEYLVDKEGRRYMLSFKA